MDHPAQERGNCQVQQGQHQQEDDGEGSDPRDTKAALPEEQGRNGHRQGDDHGHYIEEEQPAQQNVDGSDGHAQQQVVVPGLEELVLCQNGVAHDHEAKAHHCRHAEVQPAQAQHGQGRSQHLKDPGEESAQGEEGQKHQRGKADELALALGLFGSAGAGEDVEQSLHPGTQQNLKHRDPPVPGTRPPGTRCPSRPAWSRWR